MKTGNVSRIVVGMLVLRGAVIDVWAGDLDSPAAPTSAGSAIYTLEDVYNRLSSSRASGQTPPELIPPELQHRAGATWSRRSSAGEQRGCKGRA